MKIEIKKSAKDKLDKFFVWIYKNEIVSLNGIEKVEVADVFYKGKFIAKAFVNPLSEITGRILSFENEKIDRDFFKKRVKRAISKREFQNTDSYRIIHSEADFLPGLIVDRYGDNLVCSFTSAGMELFKDEIVSVLVELLNPKGIYERADKIRLKEGLSLKSGELYGKIDEEFIIKENGKKFFTNLKESQKTGFFLDQRENRERVGKLKVKKCLDLFANAGGFGIYSQADFVRFVEISEFACKQIKKNCLLNSLVNFDIKKSDVFKFLEKNDDTTYDLIVVDPPAFAKSKKEKRGALKGWKYLIVNSLRLLEEGGYLALFSCSAAIGIKDILDLALSSAAIERCALEVVEFLKQDKDHPYMLNIPNSLYLTGVILKKEPLTFR